MKRFFMILTLLLLVPLTAQAKVSEYYDANNKEYIIETDTELVGQGFTDAVAYRGKTFQLNDKNAIKSTKDTLVIQVRVPSDVTLRRELNGTIGVGYAWNLWPKDITEQRNGRYKVYTFTIDNPSFLNDITGTFNQKKDIRFLAKTTSGDDIDLVLPFWSQDMKDWREVQNFNYSSTTTSPPPTWPSKPIRPDQHKPDRPGYRNPLWHKN